MYKIEYKTNSGSEYIIYYDSKKMTDKDVRLAMEFTGWGCPLPELEPYYLIIPKYKEPFMKLVKEYVLKEFGKCQ